MSKYLRYSTAGTVSTGTHVNDGDTPTRFEFTVNHAGALDPETVRSDINTYLGTQSRTDYAPTNPDELLQTEHIQPGEVTIGATWTVIGRLVSAPDETVLLDKAVGKVVGSLTSDGTVDFRVMEDGSTNLLSTDHQEASTASAWKAITYKTDVAPSAGQHEYIFEAKRIAATAATIRAVSSSIMKKG